MINRSSCGNRDKYDAEPGSLAASIESFRNGKYRRAEARASPRVEEYK